MEVETEMRLNKENLQGFTVGSQRIKRFFAILPTYTRDDGKGRWLERVTVIQEIKLENCGSMDYGQHKEWKNIQFIDKKV